MMRFTIKAIAATAFTSIFSTSAFAQLKADEYLARQPIQQGVVISTPPANQIPECKAAAINWPGGAKGVVVTGPDGKKLRQFIDTKGGNNFNIVSFYTDGVESYREVDTNSNGKPDQYRWLGVNGTKWGGDPAETGMVSEWYVISPEEVGHEIYMAIANKDQRRLAALSVKEADLTKLKVPANEVDVILKRVQGSAGKLAATVQALGVNGKTRYMHAQFTQPYTIAADTFGGADDLVKHRNGVIFVDKQDGKPLEMVSVGELIQIGRAWKLVDGPTFGVASVEDDPAGVAPRVPKAIEAIVNDLIKVKPPTGQADMARYHMERAVLLEKCVAGTTGAEQSPWLKQLIDAYQATVEADTTQTAAFERLKLWHQQIHMAKGADEMQAYVTFRLIAAEFAIKAKDAKGNDVVKVQNELREQLEMFVKNYGKSADAPEAMNRLAVANEFASKEGEVIAKGWYERIAKDHPTHAHAVKATGAVRRLTSEGQAFGLTGTDMNGKAFNLASLGGKPAVVYFWASWASGAAGELNSLAALTKDKQMALKGLQVVTCCLDEDPKAAQAMLQAAGLPGFHLYAAGSLDKSPLATYYGIQMVPHMMIVDKDGKVVNKNAPTGPQLKDELEKLK